MDWNVLPYLIPYLISLATSTAVGVYAWRRRDVKGAAPYAWVAFSQAFWTLGYTFELLSPGLRGKIFWDDLQWLGGIGWSVAFLAFAFEYTGYKPPRPRWFWTLVNAPPAIFVLLLATNSLHGWVRSDAWLVPGEPFSALEYDFTLVVWIWAVYGYVMILAGLGVLAARYLRPRALYRAQLGIIVVGTLFPLIGTMLTLVGVTLTFHRDMTPLTFAFSNLIVTLGLFRYRLFDIVPVARDTAIEGMFDAVFVLDTNDRLVDLNPAAQEMIGQTASQAIGQVADVVFASWSDLVERFRDVREARVEVVVGEDRDHLDLSVSSLHSRRGRFTGRLIVARDITERRRTEEGLRRRAEQLRTINEVGRHIASILDVDELLTEIARTIQRVLGYRLVGLALIEGDELVFREGAGGVWDIPEFEPPCLQVGQQGITGWVARSGEPLLVPDVSQEPRYYASPWALDVASELAVPLKIQDRVIGVLHAQSTDLDAFDESDLALLESLAHQAATAIENARLYASAQQELSARRQAEEALRIAHDELERRVEERTAELSAANINLRKAVVERGQAEAQRDATMAALQENEEHYRTLFESANDAIFVLLQDRFVDCNPATEAMFGYTRDFLVGKTPYQLSPPYQPSGRLAREEATDRIEAALAGTPQSFEWRHRRADGTLFDTEVRLDRMQVGGEWMTLAVVRDITERKHAEALLRASEERYRLLAENVDDVLWVRDASLERYTYVSPSIVRLLGYTPEEMLDKPSSDYIAASSYPHVLQAAERTLAAEAAGRGDDETRTFEVEYVRKDGSTVWVESRTRPLRGEDGQFQGLIGVTRDISARKWVQQALRLYADRLEVLHEIDQGVLAARSPREIAQAALKHIRQLVPCRRASVTLIERATNEAVVLAADENTEALFGSGYRVSLDRFAELPAASPEGASIKLEDLPVENADAETLRALGTHEFHTVPLFFQDEHIGSLSLGLADASALGVEQRGIVRQVADQLAIAIANARLYESERRQRQVAEILLETSTAVASTLNLGQALLTLAGQLRSLSGFHACLICEVTESGESVCGLVEHARSTWRPGEGSTYRLAEYPSIERVLTSGQPEAIHVDDQGLTAAERSWMSTMGIAALLNLPVRSGGQVVGWPKSLAPPVPLPLALVLWRAARTS
jgi:PAS domain S-box-containing protein